MRSSSLLVQHAAAVLADATSPHPTCNLLCRGQHSAQVGAGAARQLQHAAVHCLKQAAAVAKLLYDPHLLVAGAAALHLLLRGRSRVGKCSMCEQCGGHRRAPAQAQSMRLLRSGAHHKLRCIVILPLHCIATLPFGTSAHLHAHTMRKRGHNVWVAHAARQQRLHHGSLQGGGGQQGGRACINKT